MSDDKDFFSDEITAPEPIKREILKWLCPSDLRNFARTSQNNCRLFRDDELWRQKLMHDFHYTPRSAALLCERKKFTSYKEAYIFCFSDDTSADEQHLKTEYDKIKGAGHLREIFPKSVAALQQLTENPGYFKGREMPIWGESLGILIGQIHTLDLTLEQALEINDCNDRFEFATFEILGIAAENHKCLSVEQARQIARTFLDEDNNLKKDHPEGVPEEAENGLYQKALEMISEASECDNGPLSGLIGKMEEGEEVAEALRP